ncbi:MAG: hypothetical protein HYY30_06250 [Chloroflexi bacterium]|nr:hypothetical protein [Chloroflexota bacterium]
MALAIRRAAERYSFLGNVVVCEDGLDAGEVLAHNSDADYEEVREAFEDLLVTFLKLLAGLVGRNLAMVLLREEE